nr:hypothetical protein Iba_chr07dCG6680 [Ipomoea batatas]
MFDIRPELILLLLSIPRPCNDRENCLASIPPSYSFLSAVLVAQTGETTTQRNCMIKAAEEHLYWDPINTASSFRRLLYLSRNAFLVNEKFASLLGKESEGSWKGLGLKEVDRKIAELDRGGSPLKSC